MREFLGIGKRRGLALESALYELRAYREELMAELGKHLYFIIPPQDRHFYENSPLTENTTSKFSGAGEELSESGKCATFQTGIRLVCITACEP